MASIITATTTSGLTQSADNSGVLQLASGTGNLVTVPSVTGTAMVSGNMPAFSAYRGGSAQSISGGTWTKIQINTETFDTANCYDPTTNYRFTPNVAGYYVFTTTAQAATVTNYIGSGVYKNGSQVSLTWSQNGFGMTAVSSPLIYMNGTTDYVEMYAFLSANGNIAGGSLIDTTFQGYMVRAA